MFLQAAPVCSVNSSLDGEETIKDCHGGELCMRGPVYTFYKGTQYRVFICTNTPSMRRTNHGIPLPRVGTTNFVEHRYP